MMGSVLMPFRRGSGFGIPSRVAALAWRQKLGFETVEDLLGGVRGRVSHPRDPFPGNARILDAPFDD